jgi:hypothetical protein
LIGLRHRSAFERLADDDRELIERERDGESGDAADERVLRAEFFRLGELLRVSPLALFFLRGETDDATR